MYESPELLMFVPFAGLIAGVLLGASGVGGAAVATPMLIAMGVPIPAAIATDAAFVAIVKIFDFAAHGRAVRGVMRQATGMLIAGVIGSSIGVLALDHLAAIEGGEVVLRRILGVALILAAILLARRVLRGPASIAGEALLPKPVAIVAAGGVGLLVGMTSIGAGSLLLPLLFVSIAAPFEAIVGVGLALGLSFALAAGGGHLFAGNVSLPVFAAMVAGGVPGVLIGARVHERISSKAIATSTATLIAVVGVALVV